MHHFLATVSIALASAALAAAAVVRIGAHNFTVPDGFDIELVAGTNLAPRPIEADFDEQGRLYVTDSSGSNDKVEKQLAEKPHRVVRLEDSDGDGRFDKSTTFADRMMFPEGAMWLDGSLFVAAPPSIWKLTDTNSDGVADVRVEWFKGKTLTGCANDLHGPYAGPDGWVYWCKGAFAKQSYTLPDGTEFTTRAAHIFRARPDGSGVEPVMTGGMDNPVGLAFTPEGERIVSGTFFQHPAGGKRDGLIHALYGGVYGKDHDVLDGHPRTGDLMPIMTHLGPAAPAGLMRYESDVFGKEFRNNLFTACFNLHKITRHVVEPDGATFKTRDEDFVVSDNTDFHPTDVLEDSDGSLIVVDTGGWYKLCCPTSQLHKPDVLGGIYRVRRGGAKRVRSLATGNDISAESNERLAELLNAPPATQRRAVSLLAKRGAPALPVLAEALKAGSMETRRNAVWSLTRIEGPVARSLVRRALGDADESVRWAAIHSVGAWRDAEAAGELLRELVAGRVSGPRRAAAEAIGRIGETNAVPALLAALTPMRSASAGDRALEHSLIYALIDIGDAAGTRLGLQAEAAETRRAALIALDQMPGGGLKPEDVTPLLASPSPVLKETAAWIVDHRANWGEPLARFFSERLATLGPPAEQPELQQQLGRLARHSEIQDLLVRTVSQGSSAARVAALRALGRANVRQLPVSWSAALARCLGEKDPEIIGAAIGVLRAAPPAKESANEVGAALIRVAERNDIPVATRLAAAAAIGGGLREPGNAIFDLLASALASERPVQERADAALALSRARLDDSRLRELAGRMGRVGPMELPRVLQAFSRSSNEAVGLQLIGSLQEASAARSLRAETLKPALTNFPPAVHERADRLLRALDADAEQQKARLEQLLAAVKGGDAYRGQAIFNSARAACSSCHAIGYLGGKLGPDLTRIGQVRNERDLLEALVYPSASFVRSYEPVVVATKSGDEYSGVLRKDAPDEIVLAVGPEAEQRIARDDVADMRPGTVSVMPSGLADQLSKEELSDLLAFLKATRW